MNLIKATLAKALVDQEAELPCYMSFGVSQTHIHILDLPLTKRVSLDSDNLGAP